MSKSQNLSDWFAEHFRAVRETVEQKRFQKIKEDDELSRGERKAKLDDLREAAGKKLLRRMIHDEEANGFDRLCKVQIHVAKAVLGRNRLKQPWDAVSRYVEPMLGPGKAPTPESFGGTGTSGGASGRDHSGVQAHGEEDGETGEPADTGPSGGFIPPEEVILKVVDLVQQPLQWGGPLFSRQEISEPIAVAIKHFYMRTLDWMPSDESRRVQEPEPGPAEHLENAVREFAEANELNRTICGYLDALLDVKHGEPPPERNAPVRKLYDDALERCLSFLRDEKARTGLYKRCGFVLQKLFPDHSWPVSEARLEDVRPMYEWFAGERGKGAIDENWQEGGEPDEKARAVLPVILRQHQAAWDSFQEAWEEQATVPEANGRSLLDWFASARQQTGNGTPSLVVLIFTSAVSAEVVERAILNGDQDADNEVKRAKGRMDRTISRLARSLRPILAENFGTKLWDTWAKQK